MAAVTICSDFCGDGTPLWYSCLENPMDGGVWKAAVHGFAEGWTQLSDFTFSGEGNGNPLQCSCLENPRDGEAWWTAVSGVTQSQTRLKRLSLVVEKVKVKVTQLCPTLCNLVDCTVHGILQARILKWVAYPFSSISS